MRKHEQSGMLLLKLRSMLLTRVECLRMGRRVEDIAGLATPPNLGIFDSKIPLGHACAIQFKNGDIVRTKELIPLA